MTRGRALLFAATMLALIAADQITKALVRASFDVAESIPLIDGVVRLTRVHNTGAAFGMLQGSHWFLVAIAVVVLVAIAYVMTRHQPESPVARTALAMVAAGTVGNLIDRVVSGGVTDFIDFGWFPVFNVADIALDVGVALLVWWLLFSSEHRNAHARAEGSPEPGPSAGGLVEARSDDE